jgi:phage terminase small subunit
LKATRKGLNKRQKAFAEHYIKTGDVEAAILAAGYTERRAYERGRELLLSEKVQGYIKELMDKESNGAVTAENLIAELQKIAFFNVQDLLEENGSGGIGMRPFQDVERETFASVSSITFNQRGGVASLKIVDKLTALDKLCKIMGLYNGRETEKYSHEEMAELFRTVVSRTRSG